MIQPNLTKFSISVKPIFENQPRNTSFLYFDQSYDYVPNTKSYDHFKTYNQTKWISRIFLFNDISGDIENLKGNFKVTIYDHMNKLNSSRYISMYFINEHYIISKICLVVDLIHLKVTNQGCIHHSFVYWKGWYEGYCDSYCSSTVEFQVRDIHDPFYNIPFIIGFGFANTWGVTKHDIIIIVIVFSILIGVCICYTFCYLAFGIIFEFFSFYFEDE